MDQLKIGLFIQQNRKAKNLTQKDLAEAIGVSDKTISKWENGNGMPDVSSIMPLCEALDITVNELLSGEAITPEDYSNKADNTIINLLEEHHKSKRTEVVQFVIGSFLFIIGCTLLFQLPGISIAWYFDLPTLIILVVLCLACSLLSGAKSVFSIIQVMRKVCIPIGILESIVPIVFILGKIDDLEIIGTKFAVSILSILYALFLYIIFLIIEKRLKKN